MRAEISRRIGRHARGMESDLSKGDRNKLKYHTSLWTEAVEEMRKTCSASTTAHTTTRTTHEFGG